MCRKADHLKASHRYCQCSSYWPELPKGPVNVPHSSRAQQSESYQNPTCLNQQSRRLYSDLKGLQSCFHHPLLCSFHDQWPIVHIAL